LLTIDWGYVNKIFPLTAGPLLRMDSLVYNRNEVLELCEGKQRDTCFAGPAGKIKQMMMIACIVIKSGLLPLIASLWAQIF